MHNIDAVLQECYQTLDSLNINYAQEHKIIINSRLKRRWGSCTKKKDGSYVIKISSVLLDESVPLDSLKDTVYHELLHTAPNGMSHKKTWLQLAQKVNQATGLNIKPRTPASEKGIVTDYANDSSVKFLCVCENCGAEIVRYQKCKLVHSLHRYRCAKCKGKFKVVINRF